MEYFLFARRIPRYLDTAFGFNLKLLSKISEPQPPIYLDDVFQNNWEPACDII